MILESLVKFVPKLIKKIYVITILKLFIK